MKKNLAVLALLFSAELFACPAYVCLPMGETTGGWRVDLANRVACYRPDGVAQNASYCVGSETVLPIRLDRLGSTRLDGRSQPYYEVLAENQIGFLNVRIYGDLQGCPASGEYYRADLIATQQPTAMVRSLDAKPTSKDIICVGAED